MTDLVEARRPARPSTPRVVALTVALAGGAVVVAIDLAGGAAPPGEMAWASLPLLIGLLVAGEYLLVGFRYRGQVETWNLMEAALAPFLFAAGGHVVIGGVALAQAIGAVLRRNSPVKAAFNIAQWALAAGVGSLVVAGVAGDEPTTGRALVAVVLGLVAAAVVNQTAITTVLAIVNDHTSGRVVRDLASALLPRWMIGWGTNVVIGLLFVLAYDSHPAAVVLFPLPLWALHLAQRAATRAGEDRRRQAGVHRAVQVLADPLDPLDAVRPFLEEVARAFEARSAALVVQDERQTVAHRLDPFSYRQGRPEPDGIESLVIAEVRSGRARAGDGSALGLRLAEAGVDDCTYASFVMGDLTATLLVLDQEGFEGTPAGEVAFLEGVAREAAAALTKGRLLETVLEERRKLAAIVESTSDGIVTVDADGTVRSWNTAFECITGLTATAAVGTDAALARLQARTLLGAPVDLGGWAAGAPLPAEIRITAADGEPRRLSCSYSRAVDEETGVETLVLVARDVTSIEEMEALRAQFGALVEVEAAHRAVVDQLQQAVMPRAPEIPGTELAVRYVSSDPAAPTGGDLYDWQVLPDGDLHLAVVDVLGHGVEATRHALMVMHALRVLTLEGCPLEDLVARADTVLGAQDAELVATTIVGRYRPSDGLLRLAGGGHPSALLASPFGGVRELAAPGGPIGWPVAGSEGVTEIRLEEGDALLLYTDGVVEARKDLLEGTRRLVEDADRLSHLPANDLAVRLLDLSLAGAQRRDDSLLMVLRRTGARRIGRWLAPPADEHVPRIRRELVAALRELGVGDRDLDDVALVASELVTNAVRAARHAVEVDALLTRRVVDLAVTDDGTGLAHDVEFDVMPDPLEESARGLPIVGAIAGRRSIASTASGTTVRVRLVLGRDEAAPAAVAATSSSAPGLPVPRTDAWGSRSPMSSRSMTNHR